MSSNENSFKKDIDIESKSVEIKKLPYVKPELHLLDLEITEGKTKTAASEFTNNGRDYGVS